MPLYEKADRRRVVFVRVIAGVVTIIGKKRTKHTAKQIYFRGQQYPLDIMRPAYRRKNVFVYVIDIEEQGGGQMQFGVEEHTKKMPKHLYDIMFKHEAIRQCILALEATGIGNWIWPILLGAIMGLFGGYILGNAVPLG